MTVVIYISGPVLKINAILNEFELILGALLLGSEKSLTTESVVDVWEQQKVIR